MLPRKPVKGNSKYHPKKVKILRYERYKRKIVKDGQKNIVDLGQV
jgi:hypothetical protein